MQAAVNARVLPPVAGTPVYATDRVSGLVLEESWEMRDKNGRDARWVAVPQMTSEYRFHQPQVVATKRTITSNRFHQSPFLLPRLALRTLSLAFPFADKKSSGISFQLLVDAAPGKGPDPPRFGASSSLLVSYSCASPLAFLLPIGCISLPITSGLCPLTLGGAGLGRSTNPPGVHFQSLFAGGSKLGAC